VSLRREEYPDYYSQTTVPKIIADTNKIEEDPRPHHSQTSRHYVSETQRTAFYREEISKVYAVVIS
jgi:hypothetical protein